MMEVTYSIEQPQQIDYRIDRTSAWRSTKSMLNEFYLQEMCLEGMNTTVSCIIAKDVEENSKRIMYVRYLPDMSCNCLVILGTNNDSGKSSLYHINHMYVSLK